MALAKQFDDARDIAEGIAEDEIVGAAKVRLLPFELPFLVALGEREEREVHRAHIERAHLGLGR